MDTDFNPMVVGRLLQDACKKASHHVRRYTEIHGQPRIFLLNIVKLGSDCTNLALYLYWLERAVTSIPEHHR